MGAKVRQAVIMVGGQGTRLRPLTNHRPKPALPILDKPCLMYLIESLADAGIGEVILACGYEPDKLAEAIGDGSDLGIIIEYSQESKPLGTGGAIKQVEERLDDVFIAANGDVFADIQVEEQIRTHFSTKAAVTIALTPVEKEKTKDFGIARLGEGGRIVEFVEKPEAGKAPSNLANAGIYVVDRSVMADVPSDVAYDFSKQLVQETLMGRGDRVQGFMLKGTWRDVGRPDDLLGANTDMAKALYNDMTWSGRPVEATAITKPFFLGDGSSITGSEADGAVILDGCTVKDSSVTNALIMRGCDIRSARIKKSIIGEGCVVCPGAYIEKAVIEDGRVVEENEVIIEGRFFE